MLGLKVINLYAGPGAGKSTVAAGLFSLMKALGYRVELVTERAKDYTYQRDGKSLGNQLLLLAEQDARLRRLVGEVDWVITDSPLPLGEVYKDPDEFGDWFSHAVEGAHYRYDNYDFFVERVKPYATFGRRENESEALARDLEVKVVFDEFSEDDLAWCVKGDLQAPYDILKALKLSED